MSKNPGAIMLLSATYEPLGNIDFPRAVRLMMRKVVEVVEGDETRTIAGGMPWPKVLKFIRYVYEKWLDQPARWHKGGVYIRDGHKCVYCGAKAESIDHIFPESRGGLWEWTNCVAACHDCNSVKKRNRTPQEAGMRDVSARAYVPTVRELRDRARTAAA